MCGISGFWDGATENVKKNISDLKEIARKMSLAIAHRGPDDYGAWCDLDFRVFLSHQRLAIIDTSMAGHQPMTSSSGRYTIIFNGEIYNFKKLKADLSAKASFSRYRWKGESDTEVFLEAIELLGVSNTLNQLEGMFAAAIWDSIEKKLHLVRDRFGEKPIYYGWSSRNTFIFSSDLSSFLQHPEFHPQIDRDVLALYLRFSYVPAPYSMYKGVYKLEPGCLLTIGKNSFQSPPTLAPFCPTEYHDFKISKYWNSHDVIANKKICPNTNPEHFIKNLVNASLENAIVDQMISDVNIGAFLSGGIDSSLVAAIMQKNSSSPINTFTIGFSESSFDESLHAKNIANYLGTRHFEHHVSNNEVLSTAEKIGSIYSEPFADASQIPTYILSKFAKQEVTVALSGDGADELFGGYNRYIFGGIAYSLGRIFPEIVSKNITPLALRNVNSISGFINQLTPRSLRIKNLPDKMQKVLSQIESYDDITSFYYGLLSSWPKDSLPLTHYRNLPLPIDLIKNNVRGHNNFREISMLYDTLMYLPDDILQKVDRASMSVGLEVRSPFLNHKVAEIAWQVSDKMKFKNRGGKWILKEILSDYIPKGLYERPKSGFTPPISIWLRGPLKNWADYLLSQELLAEDELFIVDDIRAKWLEHINGTRDWGNQIWSIIIFQAWKYELKRNNGLIFKR